MSELIKAHFSRKYLPRAPAGPFLVDAHIDKNIDSRMIFQLQLIYKTFLRICIHAIHFIIKTSPSAKLQ